MTCIVAVKHRLGAVLGADSLGLDVNTLQAGNRADPKLFLNRGIGFGFTSSFRMGQLIRYKLQVPDAPARSQNIYPYVVSELVESVRTCLKDGGYARVKDGVETGGTFIVAISGRIFVVYDDFQVCEPREHFAAVGCGEAYATGSLYTTDIQIAADERIAMTRAQRALRAAERFSGGVRRPFRFLRVYR